jgi:hypothetical protein
MGAILLVMFWLCQEARGEEALHAPQLLETYRAALVRLQAACGSGEIEGVVTRESFEGGSDRAVREYTFVMGYASDGHREKHGLIRRDLKFPTYFERIFFSRDGEILILERIDPGRPFYIRWISKPLEHPEALTPNDRRDMFARAAYSFGGFLIPTLLQSPTFRITELKRMDGDSLFRVGFEARYDAVPSSPGLKGWLMLDPGRDWALRAHEVRVADSASPNSTSYTLSGTSRYSGSTPFPEEVTIVTRSSVKGRPHEDQLRFRAKRRSAMPPRPEDLTLTSCGLGDYPWGGDRPTDRGGARLTVPISVVPFIQPKPGSTVDVSFEFTNPGPKPVRVVGMRIGCAARLPANDLPGLIEPGQSKTFTIKLQAFSEAEAGETRTPLYVYTTASGQAEIKLTLVGRSNGENR